MDLYRGTTLSNNTINHNNIVMTTTTINNTINHLHNNSDTKTTTIDIITMSLTIGMIMEVETGTEELEEGGGDKEYEVTVLVVMTE